MSETPETNGQAAGNEVADGAGTFTQEDVNRIVAERIVREREKFSDVDELRAKAEKWQEFEESQKSELQKAREAKEAAEANANAVIGQANNRLIQAEFISIASRYGVAHPEDAYALANKLTVEINEAGQVVGVDEAVKELVDAGRLVLTGKPTAANLNGGAGGGDRPEETEAALTADEVAHAKKMGLTPEEYRDGKKKRKS